MLTRAVGLRATLDKILAHLGESLKNYEVWKADRIHQFRFDLRDFEVESILEVLNELVFLTSRIIDDYITAYLPTVTEEILIFFSVILVTTLTYSIAMYKFFLLALQRKQILARRSFVLIHPMIIRKNRYILKYLQETSNTYLTGA
jgi:hypothetical protein